MTTSIPRLSLSHGQVMWCLGGGQPVKKPLPEQVRYLRQIGIPFLEAERGEGRGIRVSYGYYELVELGLACEALRRRIQPRLLTALVTHRERFKQVYRNAYQELAVYPDAFKETDPNSRPGYEDDYYFEFSGPYSSAPGAITFAHDANPKGLPGDLVGRQEGQEDVAVIPLKPIVARLLALAAIAPETRPGPRG